MASSRSAQPPGRAGVRRPVRVQDVGRAPRRRRPGAGPGRAKEALASTAHTGTPRAARRGDAARSASARPSPRGRSRTARTRRPPGAAAATSSQVTPARPLARRAPSTDSPPARLHHLGHPVARGERRVGPLQHQHPRPRPARRPASATASSRARRRRPGRRPRPRGRSPRRAARSRPAPRSSVCGSMVSTSARQPRWSRASSTTETSTAHTAHRSWVTTRSASRPASAPSSRW